MIGTMFAASRLYEEEYPAFFGSPGFNPAAIPATAATSDASAAAR